MRKIIRLTESDLTRLVRRIIKESEDDEFIYIDSPNSKDYGWEPIGDDEDIEIGMKRFKDWELSDKGKSFKRDNDDAKEKHNKSFEHITSLSDDDLQKYMDDATSEYDRKYPHKRGVKDFEAWLRGRKK